MRLEVSDFESSPSLTTFYLLYLLGLLIRCLATLTTTLTISHHKNPAHHHPIYLYLSLALEPVGFCGLVLQKGDSIIPSGSRALRICDFFPLYLWTRPRAWAPSSLHYFYALQFPWLRKFHNICFLSYVPAHPSTQFYYWSTFSTPRTCLSGFPCPELGLDPGMILTSSFIIEPQYLGYVYLTDNPSNWRSWINFSSKSSDFRLLLPFILWYLTDYSYMHLL